MLGRHDVTDRYNSDRLLQYHRGEAIGLSLRFFQKTIHRTNKGIPQSVITLFINPLNITMISEQIFNPKCIDMKNSDSIAYKGVEYPSAYIEMDSTIGCIRIATEALRQVLEKDGLYDAEIPYEVKSVDNRIAYYVTDEEFQLPVEKVKKIIRIAYDEESPHEPSATKSIGELKKGEFFRLKDSETAPVWVRGGYVPSEKKFSTHKYDDVNHERLCKGETEVYVGFTF